MSDTPETDALVQAINGDAQRHEFDFVEMLEHARKLERERDEARRQCLQWLEEWHLTDKARRDIKAERDEALAKHADGTCLDCGGPLQAARPGKHQCNNCDNLRHIETMLEETAKLAAVLKRERDEARQQLAELGESKQQDNPTRHDGRVEKTEQDLQQ